MRTVLSLILSLVLVGILGGRGIGQEMKGMAPLQKEPTAQLQEPLKQL